MVNTGLADIFHMKVRASVRLLRLPGVACAILLLLPWTAAAQAPRLPVTTLRYEATQGASEDEEDGTVEPGYLRHTLSARIKEEFSPSFDAALLVRWSQKDFFQSGTGYAYWLFSPELVLRRRDAWRLGASLSCKLLDFAPLGGGQVGRDRLDLGSRLEIGYDLTPRTTLSSSLRGAVELAGDPADARQLYALGVGMESRLGDAGQYLLGLRYTGTGRFPAGPQSVRTRSYYHLGALSLVWDPNRQ